MFTAEEEERLQSAFELEAKELELIITTSIFILQQAAYHLVKVSSFKPQLASLGLDEDKVREGRVCSVHATIHYFQCQQTDWL